METETPASAGNRPRPILLVLLGLAVVALLTVKLMPSGSGSATPSRPASNQPRTGAVPTTGGGVNPQDLEVRLGALTTKRPEPSDARRNLFRFRPVEPPQPPGTANGPRTAAPPPSPPPQEICGDGVDNNHDGAVDEGCGPPPPPPIPLKFIGVVEGQGKKLAALSDCKYTYRGEEGEIIDGRYRLVRIGVESVVMEYVDGRGRTTIRQSGQDCIGR